ncbi:MAG: PD-(D/E)XK nuclease family protein [Proteobacteria bacterium]|nr:PD-(D/E)XK nuclease family protein [Pseudomonadota bacterium]
MRQTNIDITNIDLQEYNSVYEEAVFVAKRAVQAWDNGDTVAIATAEPDFLRLLRITLQSYGVKYTESAPQTLLDTQLPSLLRAIWRPAQQGSYTHSMVASIARHKMVRVCSENELLEWQEKARLWSNAVTLSITADETEPAWVQALMQPICALRELMLDGADNYKLGYLHLDIARTLVKEAAIKVALEKMQLRINTAPVHDKTDYLQWLLIQLSLEHLKAEEVTKTSQERHARLVSLMQVGQVVGVDVLIVPAFHERAISEMLYSAGLTSHEVRKHTMQRIEAAIITSQGGRKLFFTRSYQMQGAKTKPPRLLRKLYMAGLKPLESPVTANSEHGIAKSAPTFTLPLHLRPKHLSASAVELLMHDPYSFYLRYVLKLKIMPQPVSCNRQHFGIALHESLARVTHATSMTRDEYISCVIDNFKQYFINCVSATDLAIMRIWETKLVYILSKLYAFEKQVAGKLLAQARERSCQITIDTANGPVNITTIADRVDVYKSEQGSEMTVVYDYKTGTIPTQQEIKQGLAPQLLLAGLHYHINGRDVAMGYIPLSNQLSDGVIHWVKAELSEALLGLHDLIAVYMEPDTPFIGVSRANQAKASEYQHLRREQEWGICEI